MSTSKNLVFRNREGYGVNLNDKGGREGIVEYVHAWIEPINMERKS
jgi:hypothetical protein